MRGIYDAPAKTTGNGLAAGPCTPGAAPTGTTSEYEEGIDIDQTKLNGGAPGASLTDGGIDSIDPQSGSSATRTMAAIRFGRGISFAPTPSSASFTSAGGYAAWSDKHPAYSAVAAGLGPIALDDFYGPEINSNVIALPGRYHAHRRVLRHDPRSPAQTSPPGPTASRTFSAMTL